MAGAAAILSGCVSASDPAMFASQGFAPGTPEMVDGGVGADQSVAMSMVGPDATETADGIPLPVPSPTSADATSRIPAMAQTDLAPGQSVVMADTSVDARNRGITQNQPSPVGCQPLRLDTAPCPCRSCPAGEHRAPGPTAQPRSWSPRKPGPQVPKQSLPNLSQGFRNWQSSLRQRKISFCANVRFSEAVCEKCAGRHDQATGVAKGCSGYCSIGRGQCPARRQAGINVRLRFG